MHPKPGRNARCVVFMKAVILAGGLGKRLRPLTDSVPKPMLHMRGKPILEHLLERLRSQGIREIILCTGFLSEKIESHFGDGSKFGVKIQYSREEGELGTGGALKNAQSLIGDGTFLVLYADLLVEMDIGKLLEFHKSRKAEGTFTLHKTDHPQDSDVLEVDSDGRVAAFHHKGAQSERARGWGNAGVYAFEPSIFRYFPKGKSGLDKDVLSPAIGKGAKLYGYITSELVKDVGTYERYAKHK